MYLLVGLGLELLIDIRPEALGGEALAHLEKPTPTLFSDLNFLHLNRARRGPGDMVASKYIRKALPDEYQGECCNLSNRFCDVSKVP